MYKKFKNIVLKDNRGYLQKNSLKDIKKKTKFQIVENFYSYFSMIVNIEAHVPCTQHAAVHLILINFLSFL